MTSYKQTLEYLYGLQSRGMKFGLRNIKSLLKSVQNPERKFPSIHIAGTNGKGSTASFLASIFMEAGYKTALYSSPHLVRFTERIRINGEEISEHRLVEYAERLRPMIEETQATFFEATTCVAFQCFADEEVDIAIVECGLGGRLDSTNVLRPLVSVITNVSFDHMEYLGNTLTKIAREKGGIIKRGVPCVTASEDEVVLPTLRKIANRKKSELVTAKKREQFLRTVKLGLTGAHQQTNASSAIAAIETLLSDSRNRGEFSRLSRVSIRRGLERVRANSGIHGRLERFGKQFILDVAHNLDGIKKLDASLPPKLKANLVVVFGVMADKDFNAMCNIVASMGKHVVAVQPKGTRALGASEIVSRVIGAKGRSTNGGSVRRGIGSARRLAGTKGKILITGSNYVVGEAMEVLQSQITEESKN